MFGMGVQEMLIIGAIALLIFGPRQLPKLGRALGDSVRELRGVAKELHRDDDEAA